MGHTEALTIGLPPLDLAATATSLLEPEFDPRDNTLTFKLLPAAPPPAPFTPPPAKPHLVGSPIVGHVLRVTPIAGATYEWQLCTATACSRIKGATGPALRVRKAYFGKTVRVLVTLNGKATPSAAVKVKGSTGRKP